MTDRPRPRWAHVSARAGATLWIAAIVASAALGNVALSLRLMFGLPCLVVFGACLVGLAMIAVDGHAARRFARDGAAPDLDLDEFRRQVETLPLTAVDRAAEVERLDADYRAPAMVPPHERPKES
jgi:hypothetical protein